MPASPPLSPPSGDTTPLVVDVDGALVAGDLSIESALRLIAASPRALFALPLWLLRAGGRAALKRRIALEVALPPATLVLNPAVVGEISAARAAGREVWLASGSDERAVAPLADAVGADGHLGSDGRTNLTGSAKAAALVDRFGEGGFDYIGNERRDLAVWKHARRVIGVGLSARLARDARALDGAARFLPASGGRPGDFIRALRPHQWIKNVLVFVPLIAAHNTEVARWVEAGVLFIARQSHLGFGVWSACSPLGCAGVLAGMREAHSRKDAGDDAGAPRASTEACAHDLLQAPVPGPLPQMRLPWDNHRRTAEFSPNGPIVEARSRPSSRRSTLPGRPGASFPFPNA